MQAQWSFSEFGILQFAGFTLLVASSCFVPFYFALFELRGASCSHRIDLSLLPQREPQEGALQTFLGG